MRILLKGLKGFIYCQPAGQRKGWYSSEERASVAGFVRELTANWHRQKSILLEAGDNKVTLSSECLEKHHNRSLIQCDTDCLVNRVQSNVHFNKAKCKVMHLGKKECRSYLQDRGLYPTKKK